MFLLSPSWPRSRIAFGNAPDKFMVRADALWRGLEHIHRAVQVYLHFYYAVKLFRPPHEIPDAPIAAINLGLDEGLNNISLQIGDLR